MVAIVRVVVAALLGPMLWGQAAAQSFPRAGTITDGDASMPVVTISTPDCVGQDVTEIHYQVIPFTVSATGDYTVVLFSSPDVASFYLYESTFDPDDAVSHCIAGVNSGFPKTVALTLFAGIQYFLVPFNDSFDQAQEVDYWSDVEGTGEVVVGLMPLIFRDGFESITIARTGLPSMSPRGPSPSQPSGG